MPTANHKCYRCDKPTVIYYDFLTVEHFGAHTETARWAQDFSQQRVAGITRLTLCAECIMQELTGSIKEHTKANGKPKMLSKKHVAVCNMMWEQISAGRFEKTLGMKKLFYKAFAGSFPAADDFSEPLYWQLKKDDSAFVWPIQFSSEVSMISSGFVLLAIEHDSEDHLAPFSAPITKKAGDTAFRLHFMDCTDKLDDMWINKELIKELLKLKLFYHQFLEQI